MTNGLTDGRTDVTVEIVLNDFLHLSHEIGAITNIALKFNFWG